MTSPSFSLASAPFCQRIGATSDGVPLSRSCLHISAPQQLVAISKDVHTHLVLAGAGTGKTTTIVGLIKYLLKTGKYKQNEILVLSFTNASASEMKERISNETGYPIDASTFHKLGMNMITEVEGVNVKALAEKGELNERQKHRLDFWTKFNDVIDERGKPFNKHKPSTDHWYTVAVGSSKCHISIDLVHKDHKIRVGLWIDDSKDMFDYFFENKDTIESAAKVKLEWDKLDNKKASAIYTYIPKLSFNDQSNYPDLMNKAIDLVIAIKEVFTPFVNQYSGD